MAADTLRVSRRAFGLLGLSAVSVGAWWVRTAPEEQPETPTHTMCPSEDEMEDLSWVRGWFDSDTKTVTPGQRFTSTLTLRNYGGVDGQYAADVRLHSSDGMVVDADTVNVDVPAEAEVSARVTVEPPESFGGGFLSAPRLGSSCDLVSATAQVIEVAG